MNQRKAAEPEDRDYSFQERKKMSSGKYHLDENEIPEGFQIFEERLEVAGVRFRKDDAAAFANATEGWLELERDPKNRHNLNAIKVIGVSKGVFGTKRYFIGYVPKVISGAIIEGRYWDKIRLRLLKTYVSDRGYVEFLFQILGPKSGKSNFQRFKSRQKKGDGKGGKKKGEPDEK